MDPGASGPKRAGGAGASRLRRRAPAIAGSADRVDTPSRRSGECGSAEVGWHRGWSNRPFVPSGRRSVSLSLEVLAAMSTQHPLSLGEVKRLAGSADTIRLRASRDADLETPIGAFIRLDDGVTPAYLLESVEGGERLGRYSFLGVGPRRLLEVRDGMARIQDRPVGVIAYAPDLPVTAFPAADPLAALRAFVPRRFVEPGEGMPRFTGGAVGALAYDAVSAFEPTVPLPSADPVGVPLASFIETDLVLVFDHLSHELSAIASLHTDAPRLEERYRIAERAIFEALERTARPTAGEIAGAAALGGRTPGGSSGSVSYTHLTLPTILRV